jgi:hypothetical protein
MGMLALWQSPEPQAGACKGMPLGGVERPRRAVCFARLMQRRVRALRRTFGR